MTNFLDFARPRAPKYQIVEPESIFDSVMSLATHAVGGRPISLRKLTAPDLKPLECDPEQLKQVLLNLIINAIQASDSGGEVLLSAHTRDCAILVQVGDEGCGIEPGNLGKIFDPFFTTKDNGTGLGLSVAHQIVEQHGGILTAEANRTRGMTFSLLLPSRQGTPI